jgi:Spy/CpxP family protein refolding chaperone
MMRIKLMAVAIAAGLLLAPAAFAKDERGGDRGKLAKKLELTADQQAKLKTIREEQVKVQKPLWEQLGTQMKELKALVEAKAADDKLTAKLDQIKATSETIETNRKKFEADRAAVLTPMQRAKTALWMGKRAKEAMEHRGKGGDKHEGEEGEEKED